MRWLSFFSPPPPRVQRNSAGAFRNLEGRKTIPIGCHSMITPIEALQSRAKPRPWRYFMPRKCRKNNPLQLSETAEPDDLTWPDLTWPCWCAAAAAYSRTQNISKHAKMNCKIIYWEDEQLPVQTSYLHTKLLTFIMLCVSMSLVFRVSWGRPLDRYIVSHNNNNSSPSPRPETRSQTLRETYIQVTYLTRAHTYMLPFLFVSLASDSHDPTLCKSSVYTLRIVIYTHTYIERR